MQSIVRLSLLVVALPLGAALAAEPDSRLKSFLAQHCYECHGADLQESGLRFDALGGFDDRRDSAHWLRALERLQAGEMPPAGSPRPAADDVKAAIHAIDRGLLVAALARRGAEGRAATRRLNRVEYENTLHDLLAIDEPLQSRLPEDTQTFGFDKVGPALNLSSIHLERYLEAADAALDAAIAHVKDNPATRARFTYEGAPFAEYLQLNLGAGDDFTRVFFMENQMPPTSSQIHRFAAPRAGRYRIRISAYAYQAEKPLTFRVYTALPHGPMGAGTGLVGHFSAPVEKDAAPIEFEARLPAGQTIMVMPYGTGRGIFSTGKAGPKSYQGIGLAVRWVEFEGPLPGDWPPESHRRLFGDLPLELAPPEPLAPGRRPMGRPVPRYQVTSANAREDAERIVREFVPRAFRRAVTADEAAPYVQLALDRLAAGVPFERAVRAGLKGVLCSPDFLLLNQGPAGTLTDEALAARLSYFLWGSCPDDELAELARRNELHRPEVLRVQVERMLASPKVRRFVTDFTGQWLNLRDIDFTLPDLLLYPEFDEYLRASMLAETEAYFDELLSHDLSPTHLVAADFAMLNERLAKHYGLAGVIGPEIRKVPLPANSHRGGILTQGAVLKVTANGTSTSPVMRGKFVADRILGQRTLPPPAGVPAVEPDIRGTVTIREQLAKHREIGACASCHRQMDPLGFALEIFDVIGGWRETYRVLGPRAPAVPRQPPPGVVFYDHGSPVDVGDELPGGTAFADFEAFRALVQKDPDRLTRCLAEKLLIYGTGSGTSYADRVELEAIVAAVRAQKGGVRSLVHAVVQSPLFQMK